MWPLLLAALVAGTGGVAAAEEGLPQLPQSFDKCPRELVPFLQYIVQRRAVEGLNRVVTSPTDPALGKPWGSAKVCLGTIYGGVPEDANVAWVAAAAYQYPWSRFHHDTLLRQRAFLLLDTLATLHADGKWDDGGLDAYFGLHSFAWAVLSWLETGAVDAARRGKWTRAVGNAADQAMLCLHYGPYRPSPLTGQYANPEFYYLAGLAAAWKVTGEEKYRAEAGRALRRYDEWLYPGGGMAYFLQSAPQHGYQQMIVKSVALYWDLTQDPKAREYLQRLAPYFPTVMHRSGLLTDAEQPHLKHTLGNAMNPAVGAMLAAALGDGANRWTGEVATPKWADTVEEKWPGFGKEGLAWYNYQAATYAAAALRLMATHRLPEPVAPPTRQVLVDRSFQGVRSHWDDFTAAVGTRQMSDSLAGACLADPREAAIPLGAAVDGVYQEVLQDAVPASADRPATWRRQYRCVEWSPTVCLGAAEGVAEVSCLTRLCAPYWGDMPALPGELGGTEVSDWTSLQHWAVWRDWLVGIGVLRCHADGGEAKGTDVARVRWRLAPRGRKLEVLEQTPERWRFRYGGLDTDLVRLADQGGFAFQAHEDGPAPRAAWYPALEHRSPWHVGESVAVATLVRPAGAQGEVQVRSLGKVAAAVMVEPDRKRAYVWAVNLTRHSAQELLDLPPGVAVRTYKRGCELPPVPPGEPANAGLGGGEAVVWVLESQSPLVAADLLAGLRQGKTR